MWVKRGSLGYQGLFFAGLNAPGNRVFYVYFSPDNNLVITGGVNSSSTDFDLTTVQVFRDPSSWFYLTIVFDTDNATASNRIQLFVNGSRVTTFASPSYPSSGYESSPNNNVAHYFGGIEAAAFFSGYLAECFFIDGQALDPSSFTTTDLTTGQLIPKLFVPTSPNNGTTWSGNLTTNAGNNFDGSYPVTNAFDNSTTTKCLTANNASGTTTGTSYIQFNSPTAFSGNLKIVCDNGNAVYNVSGGGSTLLATNSSGTDGYMLDCGTVAGITSIRVLMSGGSRPAIGGVLIDGVMLVDNTGQWGTNGFHLPFSDNSTTAALGTDTSGNGNTWTVNNFSVSNTPVYSNYLTTNGLKTGWFAGTPAQAFDSSTTTFVQGALGEDVTFTPPTSIPVGTSLRIWADSGSGSGIGSSGYQIRYNGTTIYNASPMWTSPYTITAAPGTSLSSLAIDTSAGGEAMRLFAVEIDGTIVLNGDGGIGNDSLVDTPTSYGTDTGVGGEARGNYCTINPLNNPGGSTLSNGNLDCVTSSSLNGRVVGSIAVTSGKWYWEMLATSVATDLMVGISAASETTATTIPTSATTYLYYNYNGNKYNNGSNSAYGATYTTNDIIGVALDLDAGTLVFYKNGTSQGTAFSSLSGTFVPAFADGGTGTSSFTANFGQRAFAYTAPSGFKALVDTNLPAPVVAKGSAAMDVKLYTGNGGTQTISGLEFGPDFVWLKRRDAARNHALYDIVRGVKKYLASDSTSAEYEPASGGVSSFDASSFTVVEQGGVAVNESSASMVAWTWDAGSSTVTNTAGSISSQVRANASAGFSVVTYTATGSTLTVGHGLGAAPELIIIKGRTSTNSWAVYTKVVGTSGFLLLNSTAAVQNYNVWNNTSPTSTVFTVGAPFDEGNASGVNHVAYCFAPVSGYSSMGSYVGNGSASSGPFVYTGFRPRWLLVKNSNNTDGWSMWDAARDPYNEVIYKLEPNSSGAEGSNAVHKFDFLSNGFKVRGDWAGINGSGNTIIYAAFAESPFQYARAR